MISDDEQNSVGRAAKAREQEAASRDRAVKKVEEWKEAVMPLVKRKVKDQYKRNQIARGTKEAQKYVRGDGGGKGW